MSIKTMGWPTHSQDEINAVKNVLKSGCTNYWTGTEGREFEKEFSEYFKVPYAIALMNGTVALEAALYALDIGPGDEVITPSRTFMASASCIVMRGAIPVIADVDLDSQNITVETIKACLSSRTKAIIVVHLAGRPADMEAIMQFAQAHNLKIIEDCAQAHGAMIHDRYVGTWGDLGAFSFCQDKIMTTGGEGGMVVTHNKQLWEKIWAFKDHGKSYNKVYHHQHPPGFRWLHDFFGTNWRMTEMQATIGRQQLKKLPRWLALRARNSAILTEHLKNIACLRMPTLPPNYKHANYKFYVFLQQDNLKTGWDRPRILKELERMGIVCFTGSCSEIYLERAFVDSTIQTSLKPQAKKLGETSLMFLVHPTLTKTQLLTTAKKLKEFFELISVQNVASRINCEVDY